MVYELNNKVVLVTGGANGIGRLISQYVLEEGAKHVAILDVTENGIEFEEELNKKHGANKAKYYKCDVTDEKLLKGIYDEVKKNNGYLDVVVNNAGIMNDSLKTFKKEIEVNYIALVVSTLKALELMRQDEGGKGGTIINIASIAALIQGPIFPIYFGTKSAVLHFSNCIGLDEYYSRTKVRVLTACFGVTDSSLVKKEKYGSFDKVIGDSIENLLSEFPLQTMGSAAKGVIEVFQKGESGSTWVIDNNEPAKNVSDNIKAGFAEFQKQIATK